MGQTNKVEQAPMANTPPVAPRGFRWHLSPGAATAAITALGAVAAAVWVIASLDQRVRALEQSRVLYEAAFAYVDCLSDDSRELYEFSRDVAKWAESQALSDARLWVAYKEAPEEFWTYMGLMVTDVPESIQARVFATRARNFDIALPGEPSLTPQLSPRLHLTEHEKVLKAIKPILHKFAIDFQKCLNIVKEWRSLEPT